MAQESGWTNRGLLRLLTYAFRGMAIPDHYYIALVTAAQAPSWSTNTIGDLTQIAAGNGYSAGGYALTPGETDFDELNEESSDEYYAEIKIKDISFDAAGGNIPASGDGAAYAVLTNDNATVANREVLYYWYLGGTRSVSSGNSFNLHDLTARLFIANPNAPSGWTVRGLTRILSRAFQADTIPSTLYMPLITAAATPKASTSTFGGMTQIAAGNGYSTGGYPLSVGATDFPTIVEDDSDNFATIAAKAIAWTATTGNIPPSGNGANYVLFTDDNNTLASREVYHYWSLGSPRTVSIGQAITLPALTMKLRKPA